MKDLCRMLAVGVVWGACSWKCHAAQAANQFATVSCNHPGIISIEVRGDDFHVLAPGKDEDFTADVMVKPAPNWQLLSPSQLPISMSGGARARYKVISPPEAAHSGTIYFHNYIIRSNCDNDAKIITVPAGANVIYTAYRNGGSRKSNWEVNAEIKANCSSIVFNRNWWNVPSWFAEAMTTPKPDVYNIRGTDVDFTRLYDTGLMTVVGVKQIRFSGDKYSERVAIPSESNPWTEQEVVYSEPCAVFDLIAVLEPRLSDAQIAKVRDDISWTFASGRIEQDATNPLRATCHSPRQPGEYVVTASCGDSSRVMLVKVGTYKIHEVTFHNNIPIQKDTTSEFYTGYDWRDNDLDGISDMMDGANARTDLHYHPVAYVSTDISSATGTFSNFCKKVSAPNELISSFDAKAAVKKARFAWNDSFWGWNWSTPTDFGTGAVTLKASRPFANSPKVYYNDAAELAWEVGFGEQGAQDDDLSWQRSSSQHELHLTYKARFSSFETVFYLSCLNASGCDTDPSVVEGVWDTFKNRNVKRKDGIPLYYYKSFRPGVTTADSLLISRDGECGAWVDLMSRMLTLHGVKGERYWFVVDTDVVPANGFIVKHWTFEGNGTSGDPDFPYINYIANDSGFSPKPYIGTNCYNWIAGAEVNYSRGLPGQNNDKPAAFFNIHYVLEAAERFYDPSYGVAYEKNAPLSHFAGNLSGLIKDGDGISVLFRPNPSADQIKLTSSSFMLH